MAPAGPVRTRAEDTPSSPSRNRSISSAKISRGMGRLFSHAGSGPSPSFAPPVPSYGGPPAHSRLLSERRHRGGAAHRRADEQPFAAERVHPAAADEQLRGRDARELGRSIDDLPDAREHAARPTALREGHAEIDGR